MNRRTRGEMHTFSGASVLEVAREFLTRARRNPADSVREFLGETIWHWDVDQMSPVNRRVVVFLRMLYLVGRGFVSSRAQQQAMALTYTTMLALVPAFAIMVAIFSIGGLESAQLQLQAFVVNALATNADTERRLIQGLNDMLENMQGYGGVAGIAFFVFLFFTIISLLGTLEKTLNDIWGIKRRRSFMNKFVIYWCVATLGPIFLGAALVQGSNLGSQADELANWFHGTTESLLSDPETGGEKGEGEASAEDEFVGGFGLGSEFAREYDETAADVAGSGLPSRLQIITKGAETASRTRDILGWFISLLLTIITFTLLYAFLPNTRVRLKPALIGAVTAALLWTATKWGLALSSSTLVKYDAVYGSMATIPITMFWLYLTWLIVILGAELTFAIQNLKSQRRDELSTDTTQVFNELVALRLMAAIGRAYEEGTAPPTHETLEQLTGAPLSLCQSLLFHMTEDGLLREVDKAGDVAGYVPARPMDHITVSDIMDSLRERRGIAFELREGDDLPLIRRHLQRASDAAKALSGRISLRELARALIEGEDLPASPAPVSVAATSAILKATSADLRMRAEAERVAEPGEPAAEPKPLEPVAPEATDPAVEAAPDEVVTSAAKPDDA